MDFHKLILDFTNLVMRLVKKNLGCTSKIRFFVTQGLKCKLQEISFKIITKKSDGWIFWKNLENANFGAFMLKHNSSAKIELN